MNAQIGNNMKESIWNTKNVIISTKITVFSILVVLLGKTSTLAAAFFLVGLSILGCVYFGYRRDYYTIIYFIIFNAFQTLVLVLVSSSLNSIQNNIIMISKEIMIYWGALLYFLNFKIKKRDIIFILFLVIALLNLMEVYNIRTALSSLRQIMVIFLCYYSGHSIRITSIKEMNCIIKVIIIVGLIVVILGFGLRLITNQDWISLGYGKYWNNRTSGMSAVDFTNFYSWDLGVRIKRMVSTFCNPIACAHYLGFSFLILYSANFIKEKKYIIMFLFVGLLACVSKSTILILVCLCIIVLYARLHDTNSKVLLWILSAIVVASALLSLSAYISTINVETATSIHFSSFMQGIKNGTFFGYGLGSVGYNASIMGLGETASGFSESFFSTCVAQIGYIGTFFIYVFMVSIARESFTVYKKIKNKIYLISTVLLSSVLIESFFSASAISMQGTGIYFILGGLLAKNIELFKVTKNERERKIL